MIHARDLIEAIEREQRTREVVARAMAAFRAALLANPSDHRRPPTE